MVVFLLFLAFLFGFLAFAALFVPLLQPWVFDPIGLRPESSLYRFAMLCAVIALPFFLRYLHLNSWQYAGYTLARRAAWQALAKGLLIGIAIMLVLNAMQWALDIHHFAPRADRWNAAYFFRTLVSGLASGLAVALIEETFFRGLMHSGMRRRLSFWPTALLTASLYAVLHFMKPAPPGAAEFDILNAFRMIGEGIGRVGDLTPIADSLSTLLMAGVFLSMVRERTGNILWVIGIHAGWVMIIKLTRYATEPTVVAGQTSAWIGSYDDITGWLATLWLGLIAATFWYVSRPAAGSGSAVK